MIFMVEDAGMNPLRLVFALVAGCCFLHPESLAAQGAPPFAFAKQYSADVATTAKDHTFESKMYMDNGKTRSEANVNGTSMVIIIRPDLQKFYQVMVDRKTVTEVPVNPETYKKTMGPFAPENKFEWVGPEAVDHVACTKYKGTVGEGKVCFLWVDATKQVPVKMAAEDGTFTVQWKNYKAGPQDAALFEPPAGYQVISTPSRQSGGPH